MTMENDELELDYSDEGVNTDEENSLLGMNDESGNRNEGGDGTYLELDCPDDYDQEEDNASQVNAAKTDRNDARSENNKDNQNIRHTQGNRGRNLQRNHDNGRPSRDRGGRNRSQSKPRPKFRSRSKSLHRGQNNHQNRFPGRQHSPITTNKTFNQHSWKPKQETKFMKSSTDQPNATIFPTQNLQTLQAELVQRIPASVIDFTQRSQGTIQNFPRNQLPLNQYSQNLPSLMDKPVLLATQGFTNTGRNSATITGANNAFSLTRTITGAGNDRPLPPVPPLLDEGFGAKLFTPNQKINNFNNLNSFQIGQNENRNVFSNAHFSQMKENSSFDCLRGNVSQTGEVFSRSGNPTYRSKFLGQSEVKNENANRNSFGNSSFHQTLPNMQIRSNVNMNKSGHREVTFPSRFNFNANKNQNTDSNTSNTNQDNNKFKYRSEPPQNKNNSYRNNNFSDAKNIASTSKMSSPKKNNQKGNVMSSNQSQDNELNLNTERGRPERPKTPRTRARSQDGRKTPIPVIPEVTPFDKELANQKKAERLQRFSSNNAPGGSETSSHAGSLDWTIDQGNLNTSLEIDENYMKGIEEQKKKREEVMKQKLMKRKISDSVDSNSSSNNEQFAAKKPNMSPRESLLNKKNPFGYSDMSMEVEVKKEEDENAKKARKLANRSNNLNASFSRDNVTFTRTISKSMEELGLIRSRPSTPAPARASVTPTSAPSRTVANRPKSPHPRKCQTPKPLEVPPMIVSKTVVNEYATDVAMPEFESASSALVPVFQDPVNVSSQASESVLNGCIVKIMNLPPSVSIDDVRKMCAPFGKALEIKLNHPKEQSAAVRFSNPSSAEAFYNRYHGEKIDNLFLYLVVI